MSRSSRPIYFRVLRLRHVRPGWLTTLMLFEGSILAGFLLAFADIVSYSAMLILPAVVAVLVKFNDVIAGLLNRPLAVAQLRTPRPLEHKAVGRSPVPRPSRLTAPFSADDAQLDADARPDRDVVRGIASVRGAGSANGRRPLPAVRPAWEPEGDAEYTPGVESVAGTNARDVETRPGANVSGVDPFPHVESMQTDALLDGETTAPLRPDGADRRSRGNQGRFGV